MQNEHEKDPANLKGVYPSFQDFSKEASTHPVVPVWVELVADGETPLSVLSKLRSDDASFLLESA